MSHPFQVQIFSYSNFLLYHIKKKINTLYLYIENNCMLEKSKNNLQEAILKCKKVLWIWERWEKHCNISD